MKLNLQQRKWGIAAVLFAGFLIEFFLDFTGLSLHQWIGTAIGALAAYHLITHWTWVKTVTNRFWEDTSKRSRLCYLIDIGLFAGFAMMLGSGWVISSWLNLNLANYDSWRSVHIASSIVTLLTVFVKVSVHWRWIVNVFSRKPVKAAIPVMPTPAAIPLQAATTINNKTIGRREFLKVMGVTSIATVVALSKAAQSIQAEAVSSLSEVVSPTQSTSVAANTSPVQATATISQSPSNAVNPTAAATVAPTAVPTQQAVLAQNTTSSTSCVIRCSRGCSFPGHCRRYSDANGNGRCDLGECL